MAGKPKTADPDASRGQQQKKLRTERQLGRPTGELRVEAIKIWEELRRGDIENDKRARKMEEIMDVLRGKIKDVVFKRDMSRVIQTCIKMGNEQQRNEIAQELVDSYVELSRSMYGRHILMAILKYSNKYRSQVISAFYGHVRKLIRHKDAAAVLEECYAVYANAGQRWKLVAELYGNEFAVFKDGDATSLDAVLQQTPQKLPTVLNSLKTALVPLLQKGTVQLSIVHRALLDYLRFADSRDRLEMIETMRGLVVEVVHTKEGAHAGMLCLLYGSPKDRKAIVKSFKGYLQRIACEEHGHAVLISALDCIDDTVYMNKALVQDLGALLPELVANQYGRRVVLYLLGGRNPQYVGSEALKILRDGDAVRAETSKKDPMVRHSELLSGISEPLLRWVTNNVEAAIFDPMPSQSVSETLLRATAADDSLKRAAWDAVLALVRRDIGVAGDKHVLVNPISNRVVTNCIKAEHTAPSSPDATLPDLPAGNPKFGSEVLAALEDSDQLVAAACAGVFPVRALLESPVTGERARALLKPHAKKIKQALGAKPERPRSLPQIIELLK
ncbi:Pumilio y domain member 6 [Coemansia sp. RSA 2599]|nr:Pumilio y domain member 6 [Coemansia sp. RSA 2598]KAJ1829644.1 Pumilio y domain member 6 [Coemansia sp. RSA 2599]